MSFQQMFVEALDWSALSQDAAPPPPLGHHHGNMNPAAGQHVYTDRAGYQPYVGAGHQHPQPMQGPATTSGEAYQAYEVQCQRASVGVGVSPPGYQQLWPDRPKGVVPAYNQYPEWAQGAPGQQSPGQFVRTSLPADARAAVETVGGGAPWKTAPCEPASSPVTSSAAAEQPRQFAVINPEAAQSARPDPPGPAHFPNPPSVNGSGQDKHRALAVVFPVMESSPERRSPGVTEEPTAEPPTKRKAAKSSMPLKKLKSYGDSFSCKTCKLVCSGPLNLRTHFKTAKHKQNEKKTSKEGASESGPTPGEKLSGRTAKSNPIPNDHNQESTPIVGLDFVTRVVIASREDGEDQFECSLCLEEGMEATDIYGHVMGETHRLAYIRRAKPGLADQYSNIANVYKSTGQLQRRQSSDLPALLNNLVKIAAQRDGPGDLQIRLCNEEGEVEKGEEVDCGVEGFNSDSDEFDELLSGDSDDEMEVEARFPKVEVDIPRTMKAVKQPGVDPDTPTQSRSDPRLARLQRRGSGDPGSPVAKPEPPRGAPPAAPSSAAPRLVRPGPSPPGRGHARTPLPRGTRPWPTPAKPGPTPAAALVLVPALDTPPPLTRFGTSHPTAEAATEAPAKKPSKLSLADLPSLTDEQLRRCCSDVFIAQEYRRRFGEPAPPPSTSETESKSGASANSTEGASLEELLKFLSKAVVSSEHEANIAMELTRALTQATLKFRLREKNFV